MTDRPAVNDNGHAFTMTRQEFECLVARAVGEALRDAGLEWLVKCGAQLLDRNDLARRLSCSAGHVDKMRRSGMPCLYVGDSPRFAFDDCVRWIAESNGAKQGVQ